MIRSKDTVFNFGKYRSKNIGEIIEKDLGYICWAILHIPDFIVDNQVVELMRQNPNGLNHSSYLNGRFFFEKDPVKLEEGNRLEVEESIEKNQSKKAILN